MLKANDETKVDNIESKIISKYQKNWSAINLYNKTLSFI